MPRVSWTLLHGRPRVDIVLTPAGGGPPVIRTLLADTGAGTANSRFELLLTQPDCLAFGGKRLQRIVLGRAYTGPHPAYLIRIRIPGLGFDQYLPAAGVASPPVGFDGIAGYRFLNRFTYGNFGDRTKFGLEC